MRLSLFATVFFLIVTPILFAQPKKNAVKKMPPALHRTVPDFTLKNKDSTDVTLSSYQGKILFMDFWASWCMPCRASIPYLKEVYAKYHPNGFDILSISIDAKPAAWRKALGKEQMPWTQVLDTYNEGNPTSAVAEKFGALSVPYTLLLDTAGKVLAINPTHGAMDSLLQKLYGR